ncbi:MAG TPA: vanadium-dependent haloperoxidase, partial [Gemmatimonadaceae bacterium]|nr:vanadium-dependent haloperoxidase [Gemmatimonadaceae bacterium]
MPLAILVFALGILACGDSPTEPPPVEDNRLGASVQWNERAVGLVVTRQPTANGQAAVSRILTYVSLAQYRAVVAAQAASGSRKPSAAAAVGAASVAVLNFFFPLDSTATNAQLRSDVAALTTPFDAQHDIAAGETLGRTVGAAVLAQAAQDNYLTVPVGTPPTGAEYWRSSSAAIVRSLHGTKPFFLTSANQLRAAPPPAFGSAAFNTALAEVRSIADARTTQQTAMAVAWNTASGPFTAGALNLIADSVLRSKNSNELEAARILAFANTAAFDAQIACWDSKLHYWVIRPSQADTAIKLAIGLPNHPSYPSGHSCITGAIMGVLIDAFPGDRARLEQMIEDAGMSR